MTQIIAAHQEAIVSGLAAIAGVVVRHFWPKSEAQAEAKIDGMVLGQSNPSVKALAIKVDQWIEQAVPNAGDARYAAAAAILVHDEPALAPFQNEVVAVLTALGQGVKQVAQDVAATTAAGHQS